MKIRQIALLFAALAPFVAVAEDKPLEGDLAKIQGTWVAMVGQDKDRELTMRVERDELTLNVLPPNRDTPVTLKGTIKVDPMAKPKTMDWSKMSSEGRELPDMLAIYELDGDTLKVRGSGPSKVRPTEFKDDDADPRARSLVFQRKKEAAKNDAEPKKDAAKESK